MVKKTDECPSRELSFDEAYRIYTSAMKLWRGGPVFRIVEYGIHPVSCLHIESPNGSDSWFDCASKKWR